MRWRGVRAPSYGVSPMPPVDIAPLDPAHAPEVARLLGDARAGYVRHFRPFAFDEESLRGIFGAARKDRFWGMRVDGELAGFFMLRGLDEGYARPAFGVFVAEHFGRRGLGRRALEESIRWCTAQGIGEMMLSVHPENVGARRIYEEAGFTATGALSAKGQTIMVKSLAG